MAAGIGGAPTMEGAMQSKFLRSVAVAAVLAISLAGCGGGLTGANQGDPQGAVKGAFEAAQSGGVSKLADFACAAQKDEIAGMFGGDAGSLGALGLSQDDIAGAMKMEFKDIQTTEKSRTGDNAVVHVTGTMNITFDEAKMREVMKKAAEAAGTPIDDAVLNGIMAGMAGQLSQSQPLDEDIEVVQEGGKWLICG
jgi:hypothetical protein